MNRTLASARLGEVTDRQEGRTLHLRKGDGRVDVLDAGQVGIDDDFFGIGGDSIRSIQVVARAKEILGDLVR